MAGETAPQEVSDQQAKLHAKSHAATHNRLGFAPGPELAWTRVIPLPKLTRHVQLHQRQVLSKDP
jgi:hypothetical protein